METSGTPEELPVQEQPQSQSQEQQEQQQEKEQQLDETAGSIQADDVRESSKPEEPSVSPPKESSSSDPPVSPLEKDLSGSADASGEKGSDFNPSKEEEAAGEEDAGGEDEQQEQQEEEGKDELTEQNEDDQRQQAPQQEGEEGAGAAGGNGADHKGKGKEDIYPVGPKGIRRESIAQILKNSWKDSLSVRKDKLSSKRQGSVSSFSAIPPSVEHDKDKISGSLSKRIGKAVLLGVNRLRGKPTKDHDDTSPHNSDHEQEIPDQEDNERAASPIEDEDSGLKRAMSEPIAGLESPPQTPRRYSDPPAPLVGILIMTPRDSSKPKNSLKFNEIVTVRRTWAKKDYDRKGEVTWKLTPERAVDIRNELNEFKKEMEIHEDSRCNTHFY